MLRQKLYEFFKTHQVLNFTSLAEYLAANGVFDDEDENTVSGRILVDTNVADDYLYGKTLDELQSNIVIENGNISGTLHYIADYSSAFGSDYDDGYYLALHIDSPEAAAASNISVKVENGHFNEVPLSDDDNRTCVFKIEDVDEQGILISVVKGTEAFTKLFTLNDLILEENT